MQRRPPSARKRRTQKAQKAAATKAGRAKPPAGSRRYKGKCCPPEGVRYEGNGKCKGARLPPESGGRRRRKRRPLQRQAGRNRRLEAGATRANAARLKACATKATANAKAPAFRQKAADAEGAKGGRYEGNGKSERQRSRQITCWLERSVASGRERICPSAAR